MGPPVMGLVWDVTIFISFTHLYIIFGVVLSLHLFLFDFMQVWNGITGLIFQNMTQRQISGMTLGVILGETKQKGKRRKHFGSEECFISANFSHI